MTAPGTDPSSSLVFYWGSGSPYAWRAMLGLELKGLRYASHQLQFSKGEHRSPQMLALNPRGKVPVLTDGETTIYESVAILAYLDRRYPERPLFGATAEQAAQVWRRVSEHDAYLDGPARRITRPAFFGKTEQQRDDMLAAADELATELARIEAELADEQWRSGDAPGAADLYLWVTTQQLARAMTKPEAAALPLQLDDLPGRYPNIAGWQQRFGAVPGVDRTWPPHWQR